MQNMKTGKGCIMLPFNMAAFRAYSLHVHHTTQLDVLITRKRCHTHVAGLLYLFADVLLLIQAPAAKGLFIAALPLQPH